MKLAATYYLGKRLLLTAVFSEAPTIGQRISLEVDGKTVKGRVQAVYGWVDTNFENGNVVITMLEEP